MSSTCSRRSPEKNGRRTRAPAAGRVCTIARTVEPPRVRLALGRALVGRLRLEARRPRCAGGHGDARARRAVSALWLPEDPDFPGPGRSSDEPGADHRLWRQAGLQVPKRRPRRRVATSRPRPLHATGPNQVWAYDFVFDSCANGQVLKCLTVIDEYSRECLAIDVAGGIRSTRVIEVLTQLVDRTH